MMDEKPSELERLASAVTERRRGGKTARLPRRPTPSGAHAGVISAAVMTTKERWQALGGLLMFAVIGAIIYDGCTSSSPSVEQIQDELDATSFARKLVKRSMSFPEEAEFPWGTTRAMPGKQGIWTIFGEVVGKNAFGVRIRKKYTCQLQRGEGEPSRHNWEVLILELYDP